MTNPVGSRALLGANALACAWLVMSATAATAAQFVEAPDGGQVVGQISAKETNRIGLIDDRIREVYKSDGEFTIETDGKRGDIYLRTVSDTAQGAINFFVTSEAGHTYQFLLSPKDVPAEQILVRNPVMNRAGSVRAPKESGPLQKVATGLISQMATGVVAEDYRLDTEKARFRIGEDLHVTRRARYSGTSYRGEILEVSNKGDAAREVTESLFERGGVVAISMSSNVIEPAASITVYVVLKEHADG